jgi:hypothetical protein
LRRDNKSPRADPDCYCFVEHRGRCADLDETHTSDVSRAVVSLSLQGTEVAPLCCVSGSHEGRAMIITHSLALRAGLFVAVHVGLLAGVLFLL